MIGLLTRVFGMVCRRIAPIMYARMIGVSFGSGCRFIDVEFSSEPYLVKLGNNVSATSTRFETHDGGVWVFRGTEPEIDLIKPIVVGDNVFFGYGCVILPGVTIGSNVVIGACSVVTRDVPDNSVVAGIPARILKTTDEYYEKVVTNSELTKGLSHADKKRFYLRKYQDVLR